MTRASGETVSEASSPAAAAAGPAPVALPDRAALEAFCRAKYGAPGEEGWGPRMRRRFGHCTPDDVYETLVDSLVGADTVWLDVGCGRELFPNHRGLARRLADRCARLVGVDPDPTLAENPYVHEAVRQPMDEFESEPRFDLVTMRMVAEHVADPGALAAAVGRCLKPGGLAVVFTVNRFSPVPLLTTLAPMGLRHAVKRWLWGTEKKDTFPTCFAMNTRRRLAAQMASAGMDEAAFGYLDDCRTFARFRALQLGELCAMRAFRLVRLAYPENCLLGVYRRRPG